MELSDGEWLARDPSRSYARIESADLELLARLAHTDRDEFFARNPPWSVSYRDKLICAALCQGAAAHYVDPDRGVKDFDVWSFFAAHPEKPLPARRIRHCDLGLSKFGRNPDDAGYVGRRVDFLMRSIRPMQQDPITVLHEYLGEGRTRSAQLLARKAVVILEPASLLGTVVWCLGERVNFNPLKD